MNNMASYKNLFLKEKEIVNKLQGDLTAAIRETVEYKEAMLSFSSKNEELEKTIGLLRNYFGRAEANLKDEVLYLRRKLDNKFKPKE